MRLLVAAFGDAGHVFPAIALGRALAERGHEVTVETWEERRAAVEGAGLAFTAAEEYRMFPPPDPESADGANAAEAARALLPLLEEMRPDAVVSDILTLAPALAAEVAGVPLATLIPHLYPAPESGLPFFAIGLAPPRTPFGRGDLAGGDAGAQRRPRARPPRPQHPARTPRPGPDRALPRRHQPRPGPGRRPSPSSSTRGAGRPGSRSPAR